ncbi:dimethylaniline monooxygenase [Diaporthe helianthi]|uniref:Dimethylaniline monooxygenase n=1 Tax=Diaporthe helianthi TaxID=158607 RepID=A0A2P5HKD6_DIAHE|nr:dimethylaniline monooxygenase [Diaporthe helianthi]
MAVKRVAVIGAGPAGAIAVDALAQEKTFDVIKVFERREGPGGCWIGDRTPPPPLTNLSALARREGDPPVSVPEDLPARTPRPAQPRFAESSIYPYLETNVDDVAMSYTGGGAEDIPAERSEWSVARHGADTPFRHWTVLRRYIEGLWGRNGYADLVSYNTAVERAVKAGGEWEVTLRRETDGEGADEWWVERFDALVVASGHFNVPWVPAIEGLDEFESSRPGSVLHSKMYRGRDDFRGKVEEADETDEQRVVTVGASVSAADIAHDLGSSKVTKDPVHAVVIGHNFNPYFGDEAFNHPRIKKQPSIARVDADTRAVHLTDGTAIHDVDHLIFGTGYSWSLPFLPHVPTRNNRVPGLYQHVVWREDPTLLFVGGVGAGLTFKIFEWQAVYAARLLAGRGTLPGVEEMRAWEAERVEKKGDGIKFLTIYPDFEEYFEEMRELAGEPVDGVGRRLPKYDKRWFQLFMGGHELRKAMWKRLNEQARAELEAGGQEVAVESRL